MPVSISTPNNLSNIRWSMCKCLEYIPGIDSSFSGNWSKAIRTTIFELSYHFNYQMNCYITLRGFSRSRIIIDETSLEVGSNSDIIADRLTYEIIDRLAVQYIRKIAPIYEDLPLLALMMDYRRSCEMEEANNDHDNRDDLKLQLRYFSTPEFIDELIDRIVSSGFIYGSENISVDVSDEVGYIDYIVNFRIINRGSTISHSVKYILYDYDVIGFSSRDVCTNEIFAGVIKVMLRDYPEAFNTSAVGYEEFKRFEELKNINDRKKHVRRLRFRS